MADSVETAIYRLRVEGQDQVDRLTKSIEGMATAEEDATNSSRRLTQQIQRGLAQYDPVIKAQQQYTKQLELNARARESGAASDQELAAHQEIINQNYQRQVKAINAVEKATGSNTSATKLGRYELINLGRQLQDIVVSLQGGQGFGTVMLQQGSQISDVFTSTTATLAGMKAQLAGFATAAAGYLAPLAAGGAMAGFSAVAVAAAINWKNAQNDIVRALAGIGRQSGTTIDDVNRIGFATAKTTDLSIGAARELAMSLAATGKITKDNLQPATVAAEQLAKALGIDATDAAKMLGTALADPTKGVEELDAKTGGFNVTTREQIALAMRMGNVGQAQAIMLRSLGVATVNAAKANESWTDSFKDAWKWIKDTTGAIGEMTVRGLELARHDVGGARPTTGVSTATQLTQARGELAGAQTQLAGIDPVIAEAMSGTVGKLKQRIADLTAEVERLKATKFGEDLAAWNAQLDRAANAAGNATRALIPQIDQVQKLDGVIADLTRAMNIPDIGGPLKQYYSDALVAAKNLRTQTMESQADAARYNQRVAEIAKSWGDVSQATALQLEAMKNQLPVIQAITGQQKMAAQYAADYADAINAGKPAADATALATAKLAASQAAATASVLQQVKSLKDSTVMIEAQTRDLGTGAKNQETATAAALAYKNAIESGASSTAAAAISAATLENYAAKAAMDFKQMAMAAEETATAAGNAAGEASRLEDFARRTRSLFEPVTMPTGPLTLGGGAQISYKGGGIGQNLGLGPVNIEAAQLENQKVMAEFAATFTPGAQIAAFEKALAQAQATRDIGGQLAAQRGELGYLQGQPQTTENYQKIASLQDSIDQLTKSTDTLSGSTDSLNKTNTELLSPFYTQDPRTSHIGFRSQGMASGGYIDVPGSPSMNDNMTAIIPVASGERIYVDPMASKRGSTGGTVINISAPMMFSGPVNRDEVGRTVYQNMQVAARSMQAAQR